MPVTEERRQQIREEVKRELKRQNDKPTRVWSPQITEEERRQRQKEIDEGVIPF